jgi:short-subunit dehydrogenase
MSEIKGKSVLITGAAMGIGKLMAERCAQEGAATLLLWDINETTLNLAAEELRRKGPKVYTAIVDVGNLDSIKAAAEKVLAENGAPDIVINNAGIVVGKPFAEHSHEDIERTIRINVLGVMHVARAFVPQMIARGSGHVVNIASAAGMIPVPKQSAYSPSKWAVLGFSEILRLELEEIGGNLHVTTVCPSYINTGMFDGVSAPLLTPILDQHVATDKIIAAIKSNRILLRMPFMVNFIPLLRGILPARGFDFLAGKVFGVYKSMHEFKGR